MNDACGFLFVFPCRSRTPAYARCVDAVHLEPFPVCSPHPVQFSLTREQLAARTQREDSLQLPDDDPNAALTTSSAVLGVQLSTAGSTPLGSPSAGGASSVASSIIRRLSKRLSLGDALKD
jgi:hypothetical protein